MATRAERARNRTLWYAVGASGTCGIFKFFVPIPFIEVGALTFITKKMCSDITEIYGYKSISGMGMLFGVAIGAFSGVKLASGMLDMVPGIGAGANAAATFSLHAVTGFALIIICELLNDGLITENDIKNSPFAIVNSISKYTVNTVGGFLRGDLTDAISAGKRVYKLAGAHSDIPMVDTAMHNMLTNDIHTVGKSIGKETMNIATAIAEDHTKFSIPKNFDKISSNKDPFEYGKEIQNIYQKNLSSINSNATLDFICGQCGKIYEEISNLNISCGFWEDRNDYDHYLAFVIAGWVKENLQHNSVVNRRSQTQLAKAVTDQIMIWVRGENKNWQFV